MTGPRRTGHVLDLAGIRIGDAPRVGLKVARLAEMAARIADPAPAPDAKRDANPDAKRDANPDECAIDTVPAVSMAHSYGEARGGWRVPDGYAVTVEALRVLSDESPCLPGWLADAVAAAHERLRERTGRGAGLRVAVRSSAVGEDGGQASFAGQYATYLGLTATADVCARIADCWASARTGRVEAYRRDRQGAGAAGAGDLAVGVFELVDARSAGVVFTMDPVTGDRGRMVVEANWGFGESVVSGAVTPDHWELDAATQVITARSVGAKSHYSLLDAGTDSVRLAELPAGQAAEPSLSDDEIRELCRLAAAIADAEGVPQDVEWAIARDGSVFLLQHRPETTWPARPVPGPRQPEQRPAQAGEPEQAPAQERAFNPVQYALRNVFKVPGT